MKASKVLGLSAALLILGASGFLLINLLPTKAPTPLWTEADLPQTKISSHNNGWEQLKLESASLPSLDLDVPQVLKSATLTEALTHTAASKELQTPKFSKALSTCRKIFEKPAFEDLCPPRIDARCPNLEIYRCHRLMTFACIQTLSNSSVCLEPIVRNSVNHARSARSMLSMMIALSTLESSCQLARAAVRWGLPTPGDKALQTLAQASINLQQPLIYEYLTNVEAIDRFSQEGAETTATAWLFDRGATLEVLNTRYRAAVKGSFPDEQFQGQSFWWMRNAGGKLLLDTLNTPGIMARLKKEHASAMKCIQAH